MGYVAGGLFRGLVIGFIVTILALFFTKLSMVHAFVTVFTVVMTSVLFSLAGMINAVFARSFYSMENLSSFWQSVSLFNPIVYMVNAFRFGILGQSDVNVCGSLLAIGGFTAIFYAVAYHLLKDGKRIRI